MAGRISDASINAVRERASIEDIIGAQVALRPSGAGRLKGLCPFHDEKTPSFSVNTTNGYYHCFGCGESGDAIGFVRKMEGLTFPEAIERLARQLGITLTYEGGTSAVNRETGKRMRHVEANKEAASFYEEQLLTPEARLAREFLAERGFDEAAAKHFGVGYAPGGWDTLTTFLRGKGFSVPELIDGGLAKMGSRGSPIDRFHRRLMWPIKEPGGDVVGFGARRIHDDDPVQPKYMNTAETLLFKKSTVLYGADLARRAIAQRYQAVIVEGYTDVMACHLAGVETAVASCGTAFGEDHVKLLRRLLHDQDAHRSEVIFTFDGDAAGQAAARKALAFDQHFVAQTFVAIEAAGRDPCELRQQDGDAAVRDLVANRVPLVEFAIRSALAEYDLASAEGQVAALRASVPLVAKIKDWALRDEYARRLSGWIGMPTPEPVLAQVREIAGDPTRPARGGVRGGAPMRRQPQRGGPDQRALAGEREVLKAALQTPGYCGPTFDTLDPSHFTFPETRALFTAIVAAGGTQAATNPQAWVGVVGESCADDTVRGLMLELAVEQMHFVGEDEAGYVTQVISRLREFDLTRRIDRQKAELQRTNPVEEESYRRVFGELMALEALKRQLRTRD
ncbi:MAG TPA: DNA primase [Frankiaceae bacterium]|nr:DNA primase [Frankiaceae bacterium]